MPLNVSDVIVYPVKSLSGNHASAAEVVETGFRNDRRWMIVDEDGIFITQREHPALALVKAQVTDTGLRLTLPGDGSVDIPGIDEGSPIRVELWEQPCDAVDQGPLASELLSGYLGRPCRLVQMRSGYHRKIKPKYYTGDEASLRFPDSMPFLLISEASLTDLNERLDTPVEMNRFRPNIVVGGGGGAAFQEDGWNRIRIGEVALRVVKDCVRCEITTIDQSTGLKGIEPLETLGTYRTGAKGVLFGRHLLHEGLGTIRVGDPVEILE